jgi:hypothetical protein
MIYTLLRWVRGEATSGRPEAEASGEPASPTAGLSDPADGDGQPRATAEPPGETHRLASPFPVVPFLCFWSVAGIAAFSIAGEKMPWLTTHITLPFILLSGWFFGRPERPWRWRWWPGGWGGGRWRNWRR